jgi:hypothetical protein
VPRIQFNVKVEQQVQNDFRRACIFDLHESGRPRKPGSVLERLMSDYAMSVFKRKETGRELSRLRKG